MMTYLQLIKITTNKIKFFNIIAFLINRKYTDQPNKIKNLRGVNHDIPVEIELIHLQTKIQHMIYNNNNSSIKFLSRLV